MKGSHRLVPEPALLTFIRSAIRSVWSLELLLLLRREAPDPVALDALVRELRASQTLVVKCLNQLEAAGLIAGADGGFRYAPASPALDQLVAALAQEYAERPIALIEAIVLAPSDKLKNFADAFRFKEKDE